MAPRRGWDNVHLVAGDATTPPIDAADGVLSTFVVGMLDDPGRAVERWCDLAAGGAVVLVDAAPSKRAYGPLVNAPFRVFVAASTPPTTKLRYDRNLLASLDERVGAAHGTLRERATATVEETHALGLVRLTGGRMGDDPASN
jgi:hypothetical protein